MRKSDDTYFSKKQPAEASFLTLELRRTTKTTADSWCPNYHSRNNMVIRN